MAGALGSLLFDVGASTVSLSPDLARAEHMVAASAASINVTLNSIGTGSTGINKAAEGWISSLNQVKAIAATVGVGIGAGMVRDAMDIADAWQGVSNRIRTTVDDASAVVAVQQQIFDLSQQTGASIDASAKLYQRLDVAIQGQGKSQTEAQAQAIALTKTLNEEIVVSGANTGEATHAINDLVHGLAGGVIQARQFNPIMRQMPDLANQIAAGLGVSVKQLEELVHKGLPAEQVLDALAKQSGQIADKFNALPATFARAWTQLDNSVEQYVGTAAQASAVTDVAKQAIVGLGNNIGTVADVTLTAAAAVGIWLGGKTLTTIGNMAMGLQQLVTAQGAYKTAAILSAEADVANAAAQTAALATTIASVDATNDKRIQSRIAIDANVAALTAEIAALERDAIASTDVLAASERLIAVRAELAAVTDKAIKLDDAMAASQTRAALAEDAQTVATVRLAESQAALVAAQGEATAATGLLSRAGAGLFTLLGGWPAVVLAAGAALVYLYTRESDLETQTDSLAKITKELTAAHAALSPKLQESAVAAYNESVALQAQTQAQIDSLNARIKQQLAMGLAGQAADSLIAQLATLTDNETAAAIASGKLAGAFLQAKAASAGGWLMNLLAPDIHVSLAAVDEFNAEMDKTGDKMKEQAATYKLGHAALLQYKIDQELAKESVGKSAEQVAILSKELNDGNVANLANARSLDAVEASYKASTAAAKDASKEANAGREGLIALDATVTSLSGKVGGDYAKAWSTYTAEVTKLDLEYAQSIKLTGNYAQAQALLKEGLGLAQAQFAANTQAIQNQNDASTILTSVVAQASSAFEEQTKLMGLDATARKVEEEYTRLMAKAQSDLKDVMGPLTEEQQKQLDSLHDLAAAHVKLDEAQKASEESTRDWTNIWSTAGSSIADDFAKIVVEGGSAMDDLKSIAQQTVEAIISYFVKLAVINPILNSIFGGQQGFSLLGTLGTASSGGAGGGSGVGGLIGDVAGAKNIFSGLTSSNGLMGWLFGGNAVTTSGVGDVLGDYTGYGTQDLNYGGSFDFAGDQGGAYAGDSFDASTAGTGAEGGGLGFGQAVGIAGGIYAGYNEFNNAGGGIAGTAGGLAYGVGTYALGTGVAAAASGGLAAGAAAIPVVGWVALAAMLIDEFSGGKLFGTAGKVVSGQQYLNVDDTGDSVDTSINLKGQKALFGGSKWSTKDVATDPAAQAAADSFYAALRSGTDTFAKQFGLSAGTIVSATFKTVFDNNGKPTGVTESTVGGQVFKNDTQDQFSERVTGADIEADLDAAGINIHKYVDTLISDADAWSKAVQDAGTAALAATTDIKNGFVFLGASGKQTVQSLLDFAAANEQAGEDVGMAYQRLEAAQASYNSFVAQFKPAATYADSYQAALANLLATQAANIKQANDLAIAAGAAGASEEDLANIHASTMAQEQALIAQLQSSAQSLAFSMGLTTTGSLDQVNQEISALQSQAKSGTSGMSGFANAITSASQAATAAMNLLLGDNSPLNDQEKLAKARQGLVAGTVTSDQYDAIARRLYGSTQKYVDEFNFAQQYAGRSSSGAATSGSGGANGLSSSDQAKLAELLKEQADLQKAATMANANTLAQQIAELANTQGETYLQELKDRGIDNQKFMQDLGISTQKQEDDLFAKLQSEKDSAGDTSNDLLSKILDVLDVIAGNGAPGTTANGHSTHGVPGQIVINLPAPRGGGRSQQFRTQTDAGGRTIRTAPIN